MGPVGIGGTQVEDDMIWLGRRRGLGGDHRSEDGLTRTFFEPLSALDAWFIYLERPEAPLHIGGVYVFEGGS